MEKETVDFIAFFHDIVPPPNRTTQPDIDLYYFGILQNQIINIQRPQISLWNVST